MIKNQKTATLFALLAVLMWSTVATAFKITLSYFSALQMLLVASLVSSIVLVIICHFQHKLTLLKSSFLKKPFFYLLMGGINPFLYYSLLFQAYDLLPAQQAQSLNYTWAITLSLLAVPVLGHKLRRNDVIAIVLGYLGALVIATKGDLFAINFDSPLGVTLALLSTILWACYWIFNSKNNAEPIIALLLCFLCSMPMIFLAVLIFDDIKLIAWQGWVGATYIGLFEMGLAFVAWLTALKYAESTSKISNLIFISPFVSLLLLNQIIGETIYPATIIGLILIITGLLIQKKS
ncbi:DMT family transporter [Psychromonas sp. RZ22]|uniref:DMT family transporter n=1 Tax=Psychromonas algarum TaxID=2555643 RepID=UPI0010678139|nr:DMT family transporter [Psychromonas sp. RZ22]TEW53610.1 DMT family transporter [Psychromonas sp. RZ22]